MIPSGSRPVVEVVGLGPGGADLVTDGTLARIAAAPRRYVRTRRHPTAGLVDPCRDLDHHYESADRVDDVYPAIVEELVAAAEAEGHVLYAVPGSPAVGERTVELLRVDDRVAVEVHPALSFLDLAWVRLGLDPVASGVRVVDGHRFAVEAAGERGPLLVAQCDSVDVCSEVKLALDAGPDPALAADAEVTVLWHLGLPDEQVRSVPWPDLDRGVFTPDHLTSLYLPTLVAPVAREVERFVELVATLRRECPWDREQTHQSLRRHLLEEAYEVLEALDRLDPAASDDPASPAAYAHLEEELGDLLFQVVFHTTLATEAGQFTLADVARGIHDKLRDRHPHVFGDVEATTPEAVVADWEQRKKVEKGRESVFDGIPEALPALLRALKVQKKAASLAGGDAAIAIPEGFPADVLDALAGVVDPSVESALGELLYALVDLARRAGTDPEQALRLATAAHVEAARAAERSR